MLKKGGRSNDLPFVELQIKLPANSLSLRILAFSIREGYAELDQFEIVAVCFYDVVFKFVVSVCRQVNCSRELGILRVIVICEYKIKSKIYRISSNTFKLYPKSKLFTRKYR